MPITAIYGSPRKDGNSDLLMQAFLKGMKEQGADINEIFLRKLKFSPCIECGKCSSTGTCVLKDDMDIVYPLLIKSEIIILAAPVFFYGLNALAKAMVDRTQCFWSSKYLLNKNLSDERGCKGSGVFLSVGGSKGKKTFDSTLLTVRYFFDTLDMDFTCQLTYGGIDEKGAILKHPSACDEAYTAGKNMLSI